MEWNAWGHKRKHSVRKHWKQSPKFRRNFFSPLYRTVFIYSFVPDPIPGSTSSLPTPPFTSVSVVDAYITAFLTCLSTSCSRSPLPKGACGERPSNIKSFALSIQIYLSLQPSNTVAFLCLVDYRRAFDPLDCGLQRLCRSRFRISFLLIVFHIRSITYVSFVPDPIPGSTSPLPIPPFISVSVVDAHITAFLVCLSISYSRSSSSSGRLR